MAACRAALRVGSYTFFAASLLLPARVREPACALYAFCRLADDAVDEGADKTAAVAAMRSRLDSAYRGRPLPVPADRALAAVLAHFAIPRAIPAALLEGFEWDAAGRRYETIEDLQAYAARVAGTVGAMMALLMGVRCAESVARATELGVAMQLSNIARDVGEDARSGRLYLPLAWLREAGVDPDAWLARPVFNPAIAAVVQRLLRVADGLYAGVGEGVALLPLDCRPGINAARFLYADIGHEVARRGLDSISTRAVVARRRKLWLLARALTCLAPAMPASPRSCLAETKFLVDAVLAQPDAAPTQPLPWWRVRRRMDARAVWIIELFDRLERREQAGRLPASI
ncbi:phytoene/squalene synthase family protein [Ramlibacter sp.]|uniref:phytoene/squalene synthase family protein n=1 Tax=Ramlibacter sp. TaxID=1917967 RepID=UPI003D0A345B